MSRFTRLAAMAAVAAIICVCAPAPVGAQCAMCRRALQSPEGQQMIAAFRSGIALLLLAPFSVFGIVAVLAVRGQRRRIAASVADLK